MRSLLPRRQGTSRQLPSSASSNGTHPANLVICRIAVRYTKAQTELPRGLAGRTFVP